MLRRLREPSSFQLTAGIGLLALAALLAGCSSSNSGPTGVGTDGDHDGVADAQDNCPGAVNAQQFDTDADTVGNACDNCPYVANEAQADANLDGVGDACGAGDADGDGVGDASDNCRFDVNAGQQDRDMDGAGDACDADLDGDGLANGSDADVDGDGVANASDSDALNGFACGDSDSDTCEDCVSGLFAPGSDGLDSNMDGICDAGLARLRLTVGITAPARVFGAQATLNFTAAHFSVAAGSIAGAGPYDPTSYVISPPGILVTSNTLVSGKATVGATFTQISPDPSFLPPANVFRIDLLYPAGLPAPVLSDFALTGCEIVDPVGSVVPGSACLLTDLDLTP